ncbi:valine--tRNA ligase [Candidatus Uhrbacteria bacterium CG_4_9_14_3_um_filter_36_7]|uniref:Valine--tRNA ligase n=1 Tax=Candidatus Uhrbacteria bacterium CG_4_9_14_3_um_filter_36_7 TaxID=1975033 RepID=A0A2M7XIB8_9BACT|nr:MAG: valine--tRNA ligase [Candidatus Uhrbacteria bacterium CG_4_9_14_3_um_filter_36_7]
MKKNIAKTYEPAEIENEIYALWETSGFFNPDNLNIAQNAQAYSIILPPPNANGEMHVGHASGYVVMDLLGRYHRMKGEKTLLLPGKDHAGIQSQVVYEKKIKKERGITRHHLGREAFYKEIYNFCLDRAKYMRGQEKKIGLSADWSREKFTMDENVVNIVLETFINMYHEVDSDGHGMIYRGERIINWCPRCATALSDVEVEHEERVTKLYTFKYSSDFPFSISTTRPETKLGDTAVAVNVSDKRYKEHIGKEFIVDFCGVSLCIKVIADFGVDSTFGTGALGVTPAHSAVDWEMAQKNNLPIVKVIDEQAMIRLGFGKFSSLSVAEAREAVVEELRKRGLLVKEEEYLNNLSVCERCKTAIEPLVSKQWFVDVDHKNFSLKKIARKAVENDEIKIYPERFKSVMLDWIDNIRDWCISRQIWWGPRIPVWYKGNEIVSQIASPGESWKQDEDTFDTWFSSGQWAYSTLGFPGGKDFKEFYPSSTMIMGRDILPFWAFRMIILSLYRTDKAPFKNLYFTGLIRDEKGQKMSKSKGNGIDPIEIINEYGTDAVRLSLLIGNTPGNDLNLGKEKIAGFRHFTNKLWNITRFIFLQTDQVKIVEKVYPKTLADQWILGRLQKVIEQVTNHLEKFEFSQAGEILRDFTWSDFADWYLEIAKIQQDENTQKILLYVLERVLTMWHPFMPFVTEEIWKSFESDTLLMVHTWPVPEGHFLKDVSKIEDNFILLQSVIGAIRHIRAQHKIAPKQLLPTIYFVTGEHDTFLTSQKSIIQTLARVQDISFISSEQILSSNIPFAVGGIQGFISQEGMIDTEKEKNRIKSELQKTESYLKNIEQKLSNTEFIMKAPKKIIDELEEKKQTTKQKIELLKEKENSFLS